MKRNRTIDVVLAATVLGLLVPTALPHAVGAHTCVGIAPDLDPMECYDDLDEPDHMCFDQALDSRTLVVCTDLR